MFSANYYLFIGMLIVGKIKTTYLSFRKFNDNYKNVKYNENFIITNKNKNPMKFIDFIKILYF